MQNWIAQILAATTIAALGGAASAAETKVVGTVPYVITASNQSKLSSGAREIRFHEKGVILAADQASPFNLNSHDCDGVIVVAADSKSEEGSGFCDAVDKGGDRWSMWWTDKSGAGEWGVFSGSGKFAGMTGGGTYTTTLQLEDRQAISFSGTISMK